MNLLQSCVTTNMSIYYMNCLLSHVNGVPVIGVTVCCNPFYFLRFIFYLEFC